MSKKDNEAIIFKQIKVRLCGTKPLLMHNGLLADPANSWARLIAEITSKPSRKRTIQDELDKREYEFHGSLYHDEEAGPYIPSANIEGCIRDGARSMRKGNDSESGIGLDEDIVPIEYDGPRGRDELYADIRFVDTRPVRLQKSSTIIRVRPRFNAPWYLQFTVNFMPDTINAIDIKRALDVAGRLRGLGDYRPKFGTFVVMNFDVM